MSRRPQPVRRYPRTARVNEVVREVLADEIERLSDPRLGFVTLTDVEVSPDLRNAKVFYSVLGPSEQHEETHKALVSAGGHLRASLGRQVRLKYLPYLDFREDPAIAQGQRVEEIIRALHQGEELEQ
jgi:ribosome-binding factor A